MTTEFEEFVLYQKRLLSIDGLGFLDLYLECRHCRQKIFLFETHRTVCNRCRFYNVH